MTYTSVLRREQLREVRRFRSLQDHRIARLRVNVRRHTLLHVPRNLPVRALQPPLGYLELRLHHLRTSFAVCAVRREKPCRPHSQNQSWKDEATSSAIQPGPVRHHRLVLEDQPPVAT